MSKLIEVKNVWLKSLTNTRVKDINISINIGDHIALLGKSGSGKTTLLNIINGSLRPTTGEVILNGKDIRECSDKNMRKIGSLWQDLRLIEELTVGQNINCGALGRRSVGWAIANLFGLIEHRECLKCLNAVGLSNNIVNMNIEKLSSGQKKRVAIARLLRQESDLIVADEPFSNLDPTLITTILNILLGDQIDHSLSIAQSCIVSLHRPELIDKFNRVIGLKDGQIVIDSDSLGVSKGEISNLYC